MLNRFTAWKSWPGPISHKINQQTWFGVILSVCVPTTSLATQGLFMVDDGRARLNSSAHTYWARSIAGRDKYLRDHQQAPGSRRRGIHVRPERHGGLGPAGAGSGEATGSPPTRPGSSISRGQPGVRSPARRGAWARAGGEPRTPRASRAGSLLPVLEPGGQLRPRSPPLSRTPERQEPPGGFVIAPYIAADSCHLLCLVTTPRRSLFR